MSQISPSVNHAPVQVYTTDPLASSTAPATTAAVGTLMPEPAGVDIGLAIATMVIENAFTSRSAARRDRRDANSAMIAAQKDQINQLKQEADERYAAAKLEAWGKIGEGAAGIAGGIVSAGTFGGPADRYKGLGSSIDSEGKIHSGVFGLLGASSRHDADLAGAAAKAAEMEATARKNAVENADDEVKEAREHVRTALDFLREFQSTETKSMASAIRA